MRSALQAASANEKLLASKEAEVAQLKGELVTAGELKDKTAALEAQVATLQTEITTVSAYVKPNTGTALSDSLRATRPPPLQSPRLPPRWIATNKIRRTWSIRPGKLVCRLLQPTMPTRNCADSSISSKICRRRMPS